MYFEDKIGSETLSDVLLAMINKEKYKDTTVDEYFAQLRTALAGKEVKGTPKTYYINAAAVSIKSVDVPTITTAIAKGTKVMSVIETTAEVTKT